jgi:hypothetical protein
LWKEGRTLGTDGRQVANRGGRKYQGLTPALSGGAG